MAEKVEELSMKGFIVDLIINVHADSTSLTFKDKNITSDDIGEAFKNRSVNIGYVYQSACFGSAFNNAWLDAGAVVVSSTKEINSYGILSPKIFVEAISKGCTYEKSVEEGYLYEFKKWQFVRKITFSDYDAKTSLEDSHILFLGDEEYKISNTDECEVE